MRKILLLFTIIPSLLFSQSAEDSLSYKLSGLAGEDAVIGYAVAIVDRDSILYAKGFGFSDRDKKIPYTLKTVHPIASISKTLIGISLMKAQEMGLLAMDDDINDYLPFKIVNPHAPDSRITIRHLANHTSGLKDTRHYEKSYIFDDQITRYDKELRIGITRMVIKRIIKGYNRNLEIPQTEFLKMIYLPEGKWYSRKNFLKDKPGTLHSYSNNGAALASLIIEEASGIEYTEFTRKYILNPLHMEHSGWDLDDFGEAEKSRFYHTGYEIPEYKLITLADGGFITNIEDFSSYLIAVINGYSGQDNIITSDSYSRMLKENINFDNGVFWNVKAANNPDFIGHSGGDPGVQTIAFFDRTDLKGYIILSNANTQSDEIETALKLMLEYSAGLSPR